LSDLANGGGLSEMIETMGGGLLATSSKDGKGLC
jgi:hypothetical protein